MAPPGSPFVDPANDGFGAAWDAVDVELTGRMTAAFATAGSWRDRLEAMLGAGLRFLAADEALARLYLIDVFFAGAEVRLHRQAALDRLVVAIDLGRREPCAPERLTPFISEGVAGGVWFSVSQMVGAGRCAELTSRLPELMHFVVLPYLGAEAARSELDCPPR